MIINIITHFGIGLLTSCSNDGGNSTPKKKNWYIKFKKTTASNKYSLCILYYC